ncbi:DUF3617 domain-containing protein [Kangiella aquimarina]|uniref:DUF3617 family protein n=1 Tax=Kangiella aquimarina TaxID=261965 RepID=A0ABZ0X7J1_9GAMM|nr:DUF3617 family protein [Kangiella aquimarina]WQG86304.1 DUF3617 family protein [Kangiella aquimarina]
MKYKAILLVSIMLPTLTMAKGLEVEPGLWETSMTRTDPLSGQEVTDTQKECIEERYFDPEELTKDMQGCKLTQNELKGNKLNFTMHCEDAGMTSSVAGEYEVNGDKGNGKMDFVIMGMGQEMKLSMNWESTRLGDCPKTKQDKN